MTIGRRRFLLLTASAGAAAAASCSRTTDAELGYSSVPAEPTVPPSTLPPPATSPRWTVDPTETPRSSSTATTETPDPESPSTTVPGPAQFVVRGSDTSTKVALTFHTNGSLQIADRILSIGRNHGARFTNFVIGDWLDDNPEWARKLLDAGHELANHTYTHPGFASLGPAQMASEIERCRDLLTNLTGDGGRFFRPSGTDDGTAAPSGAILRAAGDAGYGLVLGWDVEPFDYQDPGESAVRTRTLDTARGGSVVSLHFGHQGTVDALDAILDGLAGKGLAAVTATELLSS